MFNGDNTTKLIQITILYSRADYYSTQYGMDVDMLS